MNLTQIKNAPEGAELKDDEVTGLQLRVRGGNKAFYFYYRNATGQRRRPKVGDFPSMTLPMAREIARTWLVEVMKGNDPSGARQSLRAAETVSDLCDRYLKHTEGRASHRSDRGRVKNFLKPAWGNLRVPEIKKADVLALKRKMADKEVAFNRLCALISQMWKFAECLSPTIGVDRYSEQPRQRYLTQAETLRLEDALDETEAQFPHAIALIRLLYLTGARLSEIAQAKRTQYRDGVLFLPKHKTSKKTGMKLIPFGEEARAVVEGIDPRGGWLTGFSSRPEAAWQLVVKRAKLKDFNIHDLRHSFVSEGMDDGYGLDVMGKTVGHTNVATTNRYAHLATAKSLEIAEAISARRKARRKPATPPALPPE